MIHPVVVVDSNLKAVISCTVPERESTTCAADSGFFIVHYATAPLAIISTHDCGGEGEKRFSLTQGGRLRECCTTSDKRLDRLIGCCRDTFSGSINKAVHINKGQTPLITTPQG